MSRALLIRLYGRLAALHPRAFRETFAPEMQQVFAALLVEVPLRQPWSLAALYIREFGGLLASIVREHWAASLLRQRYRPAIMLGLGIYAMSLALLALAFHQASPGPESQELHGLAIGRHDAPGGVVYLSGRRLDCAQPVGNQGATRCTVSIAGEPLELLARRNGPGDSNQLGGICRARYAGREWPCSIGLRHVHVAWFAIIPEPLDLSPAQLEQLRRQQPLENLPERALWSALLFVPALTAVGVAAAIWLWFRGSRQRVLVTTASILAGASTWAVVLTLSFHITRAFWD